MISVGPFSLTVYGIWVVLGILAGLAVALRAGRERGIPSTEIIDGLLYFIIAGVVGARVVFVIFDWPFFSQHPWNILLLNQGGLSIHGAVMGGALAAALYCRKRKISFWNLADAFAPALALGEAVGRVGCDVYGKVTPAAPFALEVGGELRHNVPLYTSVVLAVVFVILWRHRAMLKDGGLFWLYVLLYSLSRFGLEFVRQSEMIGFLTVAQVASLVLIGLAGFKLRRLLNKHHNGAKFHISHE